MAHNSVSQKATRLSRVSGCPARRTPSRTSRRLLAKAVCAAMLVALLAAACSSGDSPELVSPSEVEPGLTAPPTITITSVPPAPGTVTLPPPQPTVPTENPAQPPPATTQTPPVPTTTLVAPPPEQPVPPPPTATVQTGGGAPQIPQLQRTGVPSPFGGSFSVTVLVANGNEQRRVPIYDSPGGNQIVLPDGGLWYRTYFGGPLVMEVLEGTQSDAWVRVEVSARRVDSNGSCQRAPCYQNDTTGWVQNSGFEWRTHQYHARIDLTERSVRVWNGTQIVAETLAVVGRGHDTGNPAPTPQGTFFLKEKLLGQSPGYGPYVLSLSGYSEWLFEFDGKLPNIAIHGTNRPQYVGQARSSGCIRVPNNIITTLYNQAPLGTVVEIVT